MKKFFVITLVFCVISFLGCDRDDKGKAKKEIPLMEDAIFQDENPDLTITSMNEILEASGTKSTIRSSVGDENVSGLKANDYRFKLVADVSTLRVQDADGITREVQATHVKLSDDGYAFVSYNHQHAPNVGGLVVFKYAIQEGTLQTVKVDVSVVTSIRLPRAQINAIDYDKNTNCLYLAGASEEPRLGYQGDENVAFFMVMELDAEKKFKIQEPITYTHLTSFQATSVRKYGSRVFVTTGDGTVGPEGGLYIFNANNYTETPKFIPAQHARSVDVDENGIYMLQANHERVTKFDLNGEFISRHQANNVLQKDAKSEILVWNDYLFVSENDYGLRMLFKNNGDENVWIDRPGENPHIHVTNSVAMNSDVKKDANGNSSQTNLLLLANGGKGVYWYDVVKDANGADRIVAAEKNSILGDNSANFIESKGNIVFVADGLGGLKILYIGEEEATYDCSDAFKYHTFLKDNGNDHGNPLSRKVGDVFFEADGENLVVYVYSVNNLPDDFNFDGGNEIGIIPNVKTIDLKNAGIAFGPSLQHFDNLGLLNGGPALENKSVNNGKMSDYNMEYREIIPGGVKFTFPKDSPALANGTQLVVVYSGNGAWSYGNPQGSAGSTGTGANNNGQIITLDSDISFCVLKR